MKPDGNHPLLELAASGAAHQSRGNAARAIESYRRVLALDPAAWPVWCNLGVALRAAGNLDQAEEALREALLLAPDSAEVHLNLGLVLHELGEPEGAESHHRASLLHRDSAEAHYNLGNTLCGLTRYGEGVESYRRAIALRAEHADAHWNLAHALLLEGDWGAGFEEFEWRWRLPRLLRYARSYSQPLWRGEDVSGKTMLLWWEQGYGDTIHFLRYAPLLADRGARIIVDAQPELARIAKSVPGVREVLSGGALPPEFHLHCPVMSLPRAFGTRAEKIPEFSPYLFADPASVADWRDRLGKRKGLRVGLVWSSGIREHDATLLFAGVSKSIPLALFAPLAGLRGLELHGLQTGKPAEDARRRPHGLNVRDWAPQLRDFSDTAGLLANLDLVVTVDTAVAHLAGAMGKPVWLLLKTHHCWRWLQGRDDTSWYPSMRLFRQEAPGDWSAPIGRVANELAAMAARGGRGGLLGALRRGLRLA